MILFALDMPQITTKNPLFRLLFAVLFLPIALGLLGLSAAGNLAFAQCTCVPDIIFPSQACVGSSMGAVNNSPAGLTYDWNYCSGGLKKTPTTANSNVIPNIGGGSAWDISMYNEAEHIYGFVTSRGSNRVLRLDFGVGGYATTNPTQTNISAAFGAVLSGPTYSTIVEEGGIKYIFVVNFTGNSIVRGELGASVANLPTNIATITDPSFTSPTDIKFVRQNGTYIAFVANNGRVSRLVFGAGLANNPTAIVDMTNFGGIAAPLRFNSIEVERECGNWFAFASLDNNRIFRVDLGTDLNAPTPVSQVLTMTNMKQPGKLEVVRDNKVWYLFYSNNNNTAPAPGKVSLNVIGASLNATNAPTEIMTNAVSATFRFGLSLLNSGSQWHLYSMDRSNAKLARFDFPQLCTITKNAATPENTIYTATGNDTIEVAVKCADGTTVYVMDTLSVVSSIPADFTTSSACVGSPIQFTATIAGTQTWDWGDGSPLESLQNPTHTFSSSGVQTVTVTIVTATCPVSVTKTVTVNTAPSAGFTSAGVCQGQPIQFTDQSTTASGTITGWNWDFGGGNTSTLQNPSFTFSGSGAQNVTLTVTNSNGCTNAFTSTVNVLSNPAAPGPLAQFSAPSVCAGDPIPFNNTSIGLPGNVTCLWKFPGADNPTLIDTTAVFPIVTYSNAGTYNVTLTVTSLGGSCSDTKTQQITVNPNPTAAFNVSGSLFVNNPISFTNGSSVGGGSTITGYNWDIPSVGTFTTQNVSNVLFPNPGNFTVTLTVTTDKGCVATTSQTLNIIGLVFTVPDSVCRSQSFTVTNSSPANYTYEWDLCVGDFGTTSAFTPTAGENLGNFSGALNESRNLSLVKANGQWYGFTADFVNNKLLRVNFGANLNTPAGAITVTDLGNPGSALNGTTYVKHVFDGSTHFVLAANDGNDNLVVIPLGANVTNTPTTANTFAGLAFPTGIDVGNDGIGWKVLVSDRNIPSTSTGSIMLFDFGASLTNTPAAAVRLTIPAPSGNFMAVPTGLKLIKDCLAGGWFVFVSNISITSAGDNISRLNLGSNITTNVVSAQQVVTVGNTTNNLGNPGDLEVVQENGEWYIFTTAIGSGYQRIQVGLGTSITNTLQSFNNWGTPGLSSNNGIPNLVCAKDNTGHYFFIPQFFSSPNQRLLRWVFDQPVCSAVQSTYNVQTPTGLIYQDPGTYQIQLTGTTPDGCKISQTKTVVVKDGPIADFQAQDGCMYEPISFLNLSTNSTYSWNFGDAGSPTNTSTLKNPSHTYTSSGLKTVTLTVAPIAGSNCSPVLTKQIYVGSKPVAAFSMNGTCRNTPVNFTDLTNVGADTIIAWEWDLSPNIGIEATSQNPAYSYPDTGTYNIQLIVTSNLGCKDTVTGTIKVDDKPTAAFTVDNTCFGSQTAFTDQTIGTAVSRQWSFGDGGVSAATNPTHQYTAVGMYQVQLITKGPTGCDDTLKKTIQVGNPPQPNFSNPTLVCQYSPITFVNSTIVLPGDVINSWLWVYGDGDSAFVQNPPAHTYLTSGNFTVQLFAVGNTSCRTVFSKQITVTPAPKPDFGYGDLCVSSPVQFTNTTVYPVGQTRVSVSWEIDGTPVSTDLNPILSFAGVQSYDVTLIETSSNGCVTESTQQIVIPAKPVADFTFLQSPCAGVAVPFTDLSTAPSEITEWHWDFQPGIGATGAQNPTVPFSQPGTYTASLFVVTAEGCSSDVVTKTIDIYQTQFFITPDSVCLNAPVTITNQTSGALSQKWDFCAGDFDNTATATIVQNYDIEMGVTFDYTIFEENNNYYGFSSHGGLNRVYRYDFGTNLGTTPGAAIPLNISNNATLLKGVRNVKVVRQGVEKFGFAACTQTKGVTRFSIGSDITNTVITDVVQFDLSASIITGVEVEVIRENGTWYVFVLQQGTTVGQLSRLNFGNNLGGNPLQVDNFPVPLGVTSIEFAKDCGGWYAFITDGSANVTPVTKWRFGSTLANTPTQVSLSFSGGTPITRLGAGRLVNEGGIWYLFAHNENAPAFIKVKIGSVLNNPAVTVAPCVSYGTLNLLSQGRRHALEMVKNGSQWYIFTTSRDSRNLIRYDFQNICSASPQSSTAAQPAPFAYQTGGTKTISLEAFDAGGQPTYASANVIVSLLPILDFDVTNPCAGQPVILKNKSTLIDPNKTLADFQWQWLLGNTTISTGIDTVVNIPSAGNYTVSLIVSSTNGCIYTLTKSFQVFTPPASNFNFTVGVCAQDSISFLDLSTITGDNICFRKWLMGNGQTRNEPGLTFKHKYDLGGTYDVQLVTFSCNGCSDTITKTIQVPKLNFTYNSLCADDTIQFKADVFYPGTPTVTYQWNFGDGVSSTLTNPAHFYSAGGTYTVTLTSITSSGCNDLISKTITVGDKPTVDFKLVGGGCAGAQVEFQDLSAFTNLSQPISSWTWYFGEPSSGANDTSIYRNPVHTYADTGTYQVTLTVRTLTGCVVSIRKPVRITRSPNAVFGLNPIQCAGTFFSPSDSSIANGDPIASRIWVYQQRGGLYYSTLPAPELVYQDTGTYTLQLIVTGQNGCSDTSTTIFRVIPSPNADFTFGQFPLTAPSKVLVKNKSKNVKSYFWSFGDSANTVSYLQSPDSVEYTKPGTYTIQLVVTNDSLCFDTLRQSFTVIAPFDTLPDVAVTDVSVEYEGMFVTVRAKVKNKGNFVVNKLTMYAKMSPTLYVKETWDTGLAIQPDSTVLYEFKGRFFSNPYDSLKYLCVEAWDPNDKTDVFPLDNIKCTSLSGKFEMISMGPSPNDGILYLKYTVPKDETLFVNIVDMLGRELFTDLPVPSTEGLNERTLDLSNLGADVYVIRFRFLEQEKVLKFVRAE